MPHCTPETLALAALREPLPAVDDAHLAACADCRADVASLQRGVDALAVPQLAAPGDPVAPPPAVWDAIAAATGVSARPRPEVVAAPSARSASAPVAAPPVVPPSGPATVTLLRPRRSRVLLAAAASLVVGAGIGAGAVALPSGDDDGFAVAAAALDPLEGSGASGEARVVERDDGSRVLELEFDAVPLDDGYYEVWLLDEAVARLVPVGVVQGGSAARLELPPGIDLGEYPVVDVSVEPLDGDPSHSGLSVARGVLDS